MKIGIDARFFGPFGKGLGRYTEKLVTHLEKIDSENEYVIFLREENFNDYTPARDNFTKAKAHFKWYSLEEQLQMPKLLRSYHLDLVHFPHFNVPLFFNDPFVVTIHDLIIMHFPTKRATTLGPVKYALKQFGYKRVISHAVNNSKHVITVSEFSKKDIQNYFGKKANPISVTYEATFDQNKSDVSMDDLRNRFAITSPYILYVGNVYPHKNIEVLVDAFARLKNKKAIQNLSLVLVGKDDYFFERLKAYVDSKNVSDVIFTGYASDEELISLYKNAQMYVFPSLYEGFGLPPLEAMSYGVPVLSSDRTCLPEILGDAASYFDPKDVSSLERNIERVHSDARLQSEMSKKGLEQVKKYSWDALAKETLNIYKKAV